LKECEWITSDPIVTSAELLASNNHSKTSFELYKYLCLINGGTLSFGKGSESVDDDMTVLLLRSLGFGEGPLVILTQKQLRFTMNKEVVHATPDICIGDIRSLFRVAISTHEVNRDETADESGAAQLVAVALAAEQRNIAIQRLQNEHPRYRHVIPPGLFLIRVVGQRFSFFSVRFDEGFASAVEDYSVLGQMDPLPKSVVRKLAIEAPLRPTTNFVFSVPEYRKIIIEVLDRIRQSLYSEPTDNGSA